MILGPSWAIKFTRMTLAGHQSLPPQILLRGQLNGHLEEFVEMLRQLVHVHGPLHAETDLAASKLRLERLRSKDKLVPVEGKKPKLTIRRMRLVHFG